MEEFKVKELEEELLTKNEVCRILKKSHTTLWLWVKQGIIRQHNINKTCYFLRSELYDDLRRQGIMLESLRK